MPEQTLPCVDCADAKQRFEERGFRVLGCTPHPQRPGMCVISFDRPTLAAEGALAAITASSQVATTEAVAPTTPSAAVTPTITPSQVRTAQAIVNLFETGEVLGRYGQVTLLPGDPGRLTYGRSQTTLGSGNLFELLKGYCQNPGARFGARLQSALPLFASGAAQLDTDSKLHNLLRACADDPLMRETQDVFFDLAYWQPAQRAAGRLGLGLPLAVAVVYDSHVHGSWGLLRDRTNKAVGEPALAGERGWVAAYVKQRRDWLATHKIQILRSTVYRMDAFQRLIDQGFWGLELPLVVRGAEISQAALSAAPPECYDGPQPGTRPLGLQQPLLRGLDVRLLQLGLSDEGADIKADGVFGQASVRCVKEHQIARGLPVNGLADIALISQLVT